MIYRYSKSSEALKQLRCTETVQKKKTNILTNKNFQDDENHYRHFFQIQASLFRVNF